MNSISPLDWAVCGFYLLVVLGIGIWFSKRQETNEEYFVGSRTLGWFPVGVSLFASTFSSNSFVGLPREAANDDYHLYLAILFIPFVVTPVVSIVFLPIYHRLRLVSLYEYLERRFDRRVRLLGSALYSIYTVGWMGTMLVAVGRILEAVFELSEGQLSLALAGFGLFATFYTAIGGVRAVVWTDVLQSVTLGGGMLAVFLLAVSRIEGGLGGMVDLAAAHNKFDMFDFSFEESDNFFSACAYGIFAYIPAYAASQGAIQRYVSVPTLRDARWAMVMNAVLTVAVCLLFFLVGTAVFAFYHQGLDAGAVAGDGFAGLPTEDKLVPHFVLNELAIQGLTGILLAGLFAAAMSSVDSGINNITALVVYDWFRGREQSVRWSRTACVILGIAVIAVSLAINQADGPIFDTLMKIAGAFLGNLLAVFTLGILSRRANAMGMVFGIGAGFVGTIGAVILDVHGWWYGAWSCIPAFAIGLVASYFWPQPTAERLEGLMFRRLSQE